jgi:hypothetical protein
MDVTQADDGAPIADPLIRPLSSIGGRSGGMAYYPSRDAIDPLDFRYVPWRRVLIEVRRAPMGSLHPWAIATA